jgi:4-amino-4-deoxy-L-arabinose transferase-like glycosyltransferase
MPTEMASAIARKSRGQVHTAGYRVSLVLPAWNEEGTIRQAIHEAAAALSACAGEYEIIVVDDGSTDNTASLVRAASTGNPCVRLLQHGTNEGYGAALRTGLVAAKHPLVAFTDADCQFDLTDLSYMLPLANRYDIVCGYRLGRQDPARRCFLSWGYNTLVGALVGTGVRDVDCALKVFHRHQLGDLLPESDNFFVNTEMLSRARQATLSIVEVGVRHRSRAAGTSKVSLTDVPRTLMKLLPFWWTSVLFPAPDAAPATLGRGFWLALIFIVLAAGVLLFPNLSYPLLEPDEGRYAEIGREMLLQGDWIVPTLHGQPYYDKPPLFYWLIAGSYQLFGLAESSARLAPALAAWLTVLGVFLFGRRLAGTRAGVLAAGALLLMPGFIVCGRLLIIDSLLACCVCWALLAGHAALEARQGRWAWWLLLSVAGALGILAKGPITVVLVVPPLVVYWWMNRDCLHIRGREILAAIALIVVLVMPWFVVMAVREPDFAHYFFVEQHLTRFLQNGYHERPFWYFLPVLLVGCLPWSFLLIPFMQYLASRAPQIARLRSRGMGLALLWAAWCVLFFSLSAGKLAPYILPALPALAVLTGMFLDQVLFGHLTAKLFWPACGLAPRLATVVLAFCWLVIALGTCAWFHWMDPASALVQAALALLAIALTLLAGHHLAGPPAWALCGLVALAIVLAVTQFLVPAWAEHPGAVLQSPEVQNLLRDDDVGVVCSGSDWGCVPFYAGRTQHIVSWQDQPADEIRQLLQGCTRFVVVARHQPDVDRCRKLFPANCVWRKLAEVGDIKVLLVE